MALRPSSVPLRFPLPSPPVSSLSDVPDPEFDLARAASPTVPLLLDTVVTNPSFESAAASALVAELVDFAAAYRLDYTASLVAESESDCPPSVGGECALGMDVLEDRQEEFESLAAAVPHLVAMLLAPEGDLNVPDILTPRSYAEAITVPPSGANIVDGMWIFRVKQPPGSPPVFKDRYVARGFRDPRRKPTPCREKALQHSFLTWQPARGDLATLPTWLHKVVSCSTSGMGFALGRRGPVVLTGHADASWVDNLATQLSSQDYNFSIGFGSVSWRSTCSSSVLSSRCEAEIYVGAMGALELRWLTYLLTDLGEQPRSSPFMYVDNKAIISLSPEHRLEHRTKHIALRYFLARKLQQRG
ncbi:unnamed protein product [Closterium sp. NIES-53]